MQYNIKPHNEVYMC